MKRVGSRLTTVAAAALAIALGACGEDSESPPPSGPLADALAGIGGGANVSLGVGWADPRLVGRSGAGTEVIADAVGPNAGSVVDAAAQLRRRFGVDPLSAAGLTSVGGSYAFGLRLDGVDGRRLARALAAAGGEVRQAGGLELIRIGDYAAVPDPLLDAGVQGLGAFDAVGRRLIVLAISDRARAALLGRGDRLLDEPTYRAAADCLGEVVAARMVPDKLLISNEQDIDLVAVGVRAEGEVLCVLGGTAERADQVAAALETSLAPDARDPSSGEPIGDSVAAVDVERSVYDDVEVVRADVRLAKGQPPGYLFGTLSRGAVVGMINASPETIRSIDGSGANSDE
jgi:hypothetical protein